MKSSSVAASRTTAHQPGSAKQGSASRAYCAEATSITMGCLSADDLSAAPMRPIPFIITSHHPIRGRFRFGSDLPHVVALSTPLAA